MATLSHSLKMAGLLILIMAVTPVSHKTVIQTITAAICLYIARRTLPPTIHSVSTLIPTAMPITPPAFMLTEVRFYITM